MVDATISPATPPPTTTPTDTDPALTQTVEIGEERSPAEGGVLTDPEYAGSELATEETTTNTATAPPSAPPTTTTRDRPPGR